MNPETLSADLLYALPQGLLRWNDMVALPDGGLLLTHTDAFDRRLIALNADGTLRWQRSCAGAIRGYQQRLLLMDGHPYFVSQHNTASSNELSVLAIDMNSAELARIFIAGNHNPLSGDTWAFAAGTDRLLINIGGGSIIALDTRLAAAY